MLFRNPNHTDDAAWPDEEVDVEEEQDELDAEAPGAVQKGTAEEADMDDVEALMAGVNLEGTDEVGV